MRLGDSLAALGLRKDSGLYRTMRRRYLDATTPEAVRSYSQFGEDVLLQSLLPVDGGKYVDVGAGRPTRRSNTYALYRKGWRGILIDPVRRNIEEAARRRGGDVGIHALCGEQAGLHTFYEFDMYELSTLAADRARDLVAQGHALAGTYELPTVTLRGLDVSAVPTDPYLLRVDVEGWEIPVLRGNDWSRFRPGVICIEEWDSPLRGPTAVNDLLRNEGYLLEAYMGLSAIYIHRDSGWHPSEDL